VLGGGAEIEQLRADMRRAETRHRQAVISFLTAEGDRVLGIPHPA